MLPKKIYTVRQFRKNPTKAEAILWKELRNRKLLNLKFRRQHPICGFILDFYCPLLKLGIEIDGNIHNKNDIKRYDFDRSKILHEQKIYLIRIPNHQVENNLEVVICKLQNIIGTDPRLALARRGWPKAG